MLTINFLGTGAGNCIYRCHTSMVLDWDNGARIMLDTGSGNSSLVNGAKLGIFSNNIHQILLSHGHFDHMGGLPHIQGNRTSIIPDAPPLQVYGSKITLDRVVKLFEATSITHKVDTNGVSDSNGNRLIEWTVVNPDRGIDLEGGIRAYPFEVDHISGAMGWHMECSDISVVFSGDTRICDTVATASSGVDVLIHEALGTEEYSDNIKRQGHSTAAEAGQTANLASAKRLIMTHIGTQFHSNTDSLVQEAEQYFKGQIEVANDLSQMFVEN